MLPPGTSERPLPSVCGAAHGKGTGLVGHPGTRGRNVLPPPKRMLCGKPREQGVSLDRGRRATGHAKLQRTTHSANHSASRTKICTWSCHHCTGPCWAYPPLSRPGAQPESPPGTCVTPSSNPLMTSCRPILNLKGLFLSLEESNFFPFCSIPAKTRHTVAI